MITILQVLLLVFLSHSVFFFITQKSVGEKGIDVIIEMLANVNLSNDLNLLSHGGRVIVSILVSFYQFAVLP